jgi:hypothetical protein
MQRSDSAIFRLMFAIARCAVWADPAISPLLNRAISKAFRASRFFRS